MKKRLPIVQAALEDNFEEIRRLFESTKPTDRFYPHIRALALTQQSRAFQIPIREAVDAFRAALESPATDLELHLSLLARLTVLLFDMNRRAEAKRDLVLLRELG